MQAQRLWSLVVPLRSGPRRREGGDHVTVAGLSPCGPCSPIFPPSPSHSVRGNADPPTEFLRMCGLREHGLTPHKAWPPEKPEAWKSPSPGPALRPFPSPTQPAEAGGPWELGLVPSFQPSCHRRERVCMAPFAAPTSL